MSRRNRTRKSATPSKLAIQNCSAMASKVSNPKEVNMFIDNPEDLYPESILKEK